MTMREKEKEDLLHSSFPRKNLLSELLIKIFLEQGGNLCQSRSTTYKEKESDFQHFSPQFFFFFFSCITFRIGSSVNSLHIDLPLQFVVLNIIFNTRMVMIVVCFEIKVIKVRAAYFVTDTERLWKVPFFLWKQNRLNAPWHVIGLFLANVLACG